LQCGQHRFPRLSIVRSFLTSALERRRLEEPRSTELRIPGPVLLRKAIQSRHFLFPSDLPFGFVILPDTLIRYVRGGGLWLPFCGRRREVLGRGSSPTRFTREPVRHRTLRSLIDRRKRKGKRTGQFLLLGSASIDLLQQSAETLAGRIAYMELTPFLESEVVGFSPNAGQALWVRGGFPDSFLAQTEVQSFE
jgi:hypothetical protein